MNLDVSLDEVKVRERENCGLKYQFGWPSDSGSTNFFFLEGQEKTEENKVEREITVTLKYSVVQTEKETLRHLASSLLAC